MTRLTQSGPAPTAMRLGAAPPQLLPDDRRDGEQSENEGRVVATDAPADVGQVAAADEGECCGPEGMLVELPTNWLAPRKNSMPARVTMKAGTPT